jgi:uncharacterized protein YdeI (YjbR/CyaY-like superfamily)
MKIGKTLYFTTRAQWRAWLARHHKKEKEIWLIYYKKQSSKPRISYNDAVEEALCYGWIDSTVKGIDEQKFAQRFSPRRPTSVLSQMNRERIESLTAQKKMTKAGLAALAHVYNPNRKKKAFKIPPDILAAIKQNEDAWHNFQKFPESYKRIRIAFIDSRRRHSQELFQKALQHFITMTAQNKRFGYVKEMR